MSFAPGDEVVCVRLGKVGEGSTAIQAQMRSRGYVHPKLHQHYTVRDVCCAGTGLLLVEIVNPPLLRGEVSWAADCFRPVKRETIEIFRQMCVSNKPLVDIEP